MSFDFFTWSIASTVVIYAIEAGAIMHFRTKGLHVLATMMVASLANYAIMDKSGWVQPAPSSDNAYSEHQKQMMMIYGGITLACLIVTGMLLQKFGHLPLLSVIGFQTITSWLVGLGSYLIHII